MADYLHINERDKIDIKCICGQTVSFRLLSIATATKCPKCGNIILRSSIEKQKAIQ